MRLLTPGSPIARWRVSAIAEERYDLPDAAMPGAMDPAFFLTRDRNVIPHEYPCRTAFAAAHRGRRPDVRGTPAFVRNWLPFGAPALDLSGFWFRPSRLSAWAETVILAEAPGPARLRLATSGGAVLFLNGAETGHLAPYTRNKDAEAAIPVTLAAGHNRLRVFLDDLAERDTRFGFRLDWLAGPPAHQADPFDAPPEVVAEIESALDSMRFEQPAYATGEVALVLALARPARATIAIEGESIRPRHVILARDVIAGRIPLGPAETLPPDFRRYTVTLEAGGFTASRSLGLEIARDPGPPPPDRIAEALSTAAARGEPDPMTALARLATGSPGAETEAMIAGFLEPIADCWDCADFYLVPLLWIRARFAPALSGGLLADIDRTILAYRYWLDEPGNDVQWYFSENHALLMHAAAYLAGHLLPQARFTRSGRPGVLQSATGRERVRAWLDHFERWEMAEFNSAPYFPIDLKGLTALQALAPDPDIRERAARAIARLLEIVANSAHQGILTAAQGRSYEHSLRAAASLELSAIARLLWGSGSIGARLHALPQLALCLREHGLALPDLTPRAFWQSDSEQEWSFRQGENGFAALTHSKTRAWALGTAAQYRWREWGYQETLVHARIGTNPQSQIWINHPGELLQSGSARPSYWGGSASIPRVQQYRGLALVAFDGTPPQPDLTHAWFPRPAFDESHVAGHAAFARGGDGLAALIADGPLDEITTGPSAHAELRRPGRHARWLLRLGQGDLAPFRARFAALALTEHPDGRIIVDDPDYGVVEFNPDATVTAEGRTIDPARWTLEGTRTERSDFQGRTS
ncbi:MAG TPA: hypothetical protein VFN28_00485 [Amaricoccus sp.]|nr:hypothetical protein [Amaricoccus sp.]